jgi:hypothetical protein
MEVTYKHFGDDVIRRSSARPFHTDGKMKSVNDLDYENAKRRLARRRLARKKLYRKISVIVAMGFAIIGAYSCRAGVKAILGDYEL